MATVTGYLKSKMDEINDSTIVDGNVVGDNLILLRRDGGEIDAGSVRGPTGDPGVSEEDYIAGLADKVTTDEMTSAIASAIAPFAKGFVFDSGLFNVSTAGVSTVVEAYNGTVSLEVNRKYEIVLSARNCYGSDTQDVFLIKLRLDDVNMEPTGLNVSVGDPGAFLPPFQNTIPFTTTSGDHSLVCNIQRTFGDGSFHLEARVQIYDVGPA